MPCLIKIWKTMPLKYKRFKSILKDTSIALRDYIEQLLKIFKNSPHQLSISQMKLIRLYKTKQTLSENETEYKNIIKWFSWKTKHLLYCIVDYREDFL